MSDHECCATCKGTGFIMCQSLCPRCGGSKMNTAKILAAQVQKGTFTNAEGTFEFERIGERPSK